MLNFSTVYESYEKAVANFIKLFFIITTPRVEHHRVDFSQNIRLFAIMESYEKFMANIFTPLYLNTSRM
jgi:hypothetical protein